MNPVESYNSWKWQPVICLKRIDDDRLQAHSTVKYTLRPRRQSTVYSYSDLEEEEEEEDPFATDDGGSDYSEEEENIEDDDDASIGSYDAVDSPQPSTSRQATINRKVSFYIYYVALSLSTFQ